MEITRDAKLAALLRIPWTVTIEQSDEGYFVARCLEIPGSIATGGEGEIEREFWESLRESLACLLDNNDPIPLPPSVSQLPWEVPILRTTLAPLVDDDARTGSLGAVTAEPRRVDEAVAA